MEKLEALVVQQSPYSETTLLVRLLTRDQGHVRALVKGARRPNAHALAAACEPFSWVEANLNRRAPDALGTLTAVGLREGWPWLRRDVARVAFAALALEVLAELAAASACDPFFFQEGLRYLTALEHVPGPGALTSALLLRLLHHAGFAPRPSPGLEAWLAADAADTAGAAGDDTAAAPAPRRLVYHFADTLLGLPNELMLGQTPAGQLPPPGPTLTLPLEALLPLLKPRNLLLEPPELRQPPDLRSGAGPRVLRWLIRIWEDHLQRRLRTADYLEEMVLGTPRRH